MKKTIFVLCMISLLFITSGCGNESNKKEATKEELKCKDGTIMVEGSCKEYEDIKDSVIILSCPEEYKLDSEQTHCNKVLSKAASVNSQCPSGYTLKSGKCSKTVTAKVNVNSTCLSGGKLVGDQCKYYHYDGSPYYTTAIRKKSCPSGYKNTSGDNCSKTVTTSVSKTYYCSNDDLLDGYSLNGINCIKVLQKEVIKNDGCEDSNYELIDKKCVLFKKSEEQASNNLDNNEGGE